MDNLLLGEGVQYLAASERLVGSRARDLGDALCAARVEGCRTLVLDLSDCRTIDFLGVDALARALEAGLELSLVVGAFFDFSAELLTLCLNRSGIFIHYSLEQAIERHWRGRVGGRVGRKAGRALRA